VKAFRRSRCPRWCRCSRRRCTPQLRSVLPLLVHGLFFFRCGARRGALLPWLAAGAPVWPRPPLDRHSGGAFSFSLSQRSLRWGGKGKPQWGWWRWTTSSLPPPLAFEPQRRKGRAKSLRCPGLDCPGTRGGAASPLCATEVTGTRRGGKRGFSSPGPGSIRARARPAPRRAGRPAGATIPSRVPSPARCGLVDPPPGAGKGGKGMRERRKTVADRWTPPRSDSSRKRRRGKRLVAGPAR
jgi:hypothetical protein